MTDADHRDLVLAEAVERDPGRRPAGDLGRHDLVAEWPRASPRSPALTPMVTFLRCVRPGPIGALLMDRPARPP